MKFFLGVTLTAILKLIELAIAACVVSGMIMLNGLMFRHNFVFGTVFYNTFWALFLVYLLKRLVAFLTGGQLFGKS